MRWKWDQRVGTSKTEAVASGVDFDPFLLPKYAPKMLYLTELDVRAPGMAPSLRDSVVNGGVVQVLFS